MTCTHTIKTARYVEEEWQEWGSDIPAHWEYGETETYEDIDLHRYRCTQCKEVFYYSTRAREYYEDGIPHDIWINRPKGY